MAVQLATPTETCESVQPDTTNEPELVPVRLHVTVPVGVMAPLPESVTVAVHVVELLIGTLVGVQLTAVAVSRLTTDNPKPPLPPLCVPSPPYVPVIVWTAAAALVGV
jgi:hypothetical protein